MGILNKLFSSKESKVFPPIPKWKPNLPINYELIVDRAKYYTDQKLQFVVFEQGTVVYFSELVEGIELLAKSRLDQIYHSMPDMKPLTMDDGNYLVQYSQPAFTIVFKDEIDMHWGYIDKNHRYGVCTNEVLINAQGKGNKFDFLGKICLFGRSKMFMDAQHPKIMSVFNPSR